MGCEGENRYFFYIGHGFLPVVSLFVTCSVCPLYRVRSYYFSVISGCTAFSVFSCLLFHGVTFATAEHQENLCEALQPDTELVMCTDI